MFDSLNCDLKITVYIFENSSKQNTVQNVAKYSNACDNVFGEKKNENYLLKTLSCPQNGSNTVSTYVKGTHIS